ncbi:hypothetical protein VC83_09679 [Pseudogymnoascus destructans]|uniref:Reverse transcriptase Ty1/copia-type domain-containing protein n=1 Tax=Pseudogymnoascus destructans TaxID=655981 RepID=A0A2P6FGP6_9PEZI|nr:uncharacterized protein VC83_09679 [Pseudogymnoascus destructans]PQM43552.1 hypothetical protein VC83_09679 [Pseudogymnoascus destructans]
MWVFTYKFDNSGFLVKYKARLVVRGDLQRYSIHDETYAATLASRTFRALMAITAYFDLDTDQMDAINAFTNSRIDEEVYVRCADGYKEQGMCWKLNRALYGLRQSPLLWFRDFSETLTSLGLTQVPEAQCLFVSDTIIVFFYVDDICILSHPRHKREAIDFHTKLMEAYEFREIGELNWFLGIRIVRDRTQRKLWMCQDSYIEKIIASYKVTQTRMPRTPMITVELTPYNGQATKQEIHLYQRKIGSVNYAAVVTRPDIARTTQKLAEFLINPGPDHHAAADRLLLYLQGTKNYALQYGPNIDEPRFQCSSDASYADCEETRRSTEGYLFTLFGGAIDWRCTKQKTVSTSTTEAELLALSHCAKQLYWWQRFFSMIKLELHEEYTLQCDNLQTVRLLLKESPKLVTKLKHIDVHSHWLRQEVEHQKIHINWITTHEMPADGFTKALSRQKHEDFIKHLNLVDISRLL